MTHPETPLTNDDSWSTGDEAFDRRIRLSLAERDALRATNAELVAALEDVLTRPVVEAEGTNPLVVTIHVAAERVEKWRAALSKAREEQS